MLDEEYFDTAFVCAFASAFVCVLDVHSHLRLHSIRIRIYHNIRIPVHTSVIHALPVPEPQERTNVCASQSKEKSGH